MHASLAPSAAAALLDADGRLTVWSHSQGIELLRGCLARVLRMDAENIHVVHAAGAGSYGHNGADDAALDAALCARALPRRPTCGWKPPWMNRVESLDGRTTSGVSRTWDGQGPMLRTA
jgi:CO/xanthine dehydrogenase Mo-binding subunit